MTRGQDIEHSAADGDQSSGTQQLETALVIIQVVALVRIDEGEIEGAGPPLREQSVQCLDGRAQSQIDLVRHAGFDPVPPGDRGPLLTHVAGDDFSVGGQRQRHRNGTVASEHAHFERHPCA